VLLDIPVFKENSSQVLVAHTSNLCYLEGLDQPRHIVHETPISKMPRAKWARGMAQVVGCLLCKCKTLSSNPSPTRKKKKKSKGKENPRAISVAEVVEPPA
jgi:hypothetical protein